MIQLRLDHYTEQDKRALYEAMLAAMSYASRRDKSKLVIKDIDYVVDWLGRKISSTELEV